MAQRYRGSKDGTSHRSRNSDLNERSHLFRKNSVPLHHDENDAEQITSDQAISIHETPFQQSIQNDDRNEPREYQPRINYCKTSCKRLPKGKGVILVFLIYFLESFSFYSTLAGLQQILLRDQPTSIWIFTFLEGTAGRVVYPVAGVIADTYLGRYQVIHIGLWLLWIGFAILALSQSLIGLYTNSVMISHILPIVSAVFISIGAGSVEVNTVSFGVDQLAQGAPSEELSSYFYWYYFNRNTGYLAAIIVSLLLFRLPDQSYTLYSVQSVFAVTSISIALLLHYCLQSWYFKDRKRENPLKSIINVVYFSATVRRHPPVFRRAFRHGEGKKPRIELAKIDYDGIFSAEEVENVKTFCRILFLIFTLGGYFATYGAAYSMLGFQINKATIEFLGQENAQFTSYFASNLLTLINVLTFVIFLPILNHILIPFLSGFTMRIRIGTGLVCNLLCVAVAAVIQVKAFSQWWLVVPAVLVSLGDALTVVVGVEFIYAQSPETMKGLLTGLLYLAYGVFRGGGIVFFHFFSFLDWNRDYTIMCFYVLFTVIATLGFVGYVIVARLYQYRQRPTGDDSENDVIRRGWAQNVFGNPQV